MCAWMWIRIRLDPYIFPDLELKRNIFPNLGSDLLYSLWGKNLKKKWEKLIKILPQTKDRKTLKLKLNQNFIFLMLLI